MSERTDSAKRALGLVGYHRDLHHGWRRAALLLSIAATAQAVAFALYIAWHSTVYITVAATPDGRVIEMTPLDEPIMSDAALRNWTVSAVTEAFTLGHHDWRMRLSAVRQHFTDAGYASYLAGLEDSLFLARLQDHLQVASAVATGTPVITDVRVIDGRAAWDVEFPLLVTFQAGTRTASQKLRARVLVMRVPLSDRASGIGIQQIIATRQGA